MRPLSRLVLLACVLPSAALASGVNWFQPGKDAQHIGYNAKETVLNTANVANLRLSWTATTNADIDAPLVTDGRKLFVMSTDGTLYAYSARHGKLLWSVVVNKNGAPGNWGLVASGSTVYANCQLDYDGSPWRGHGGLCAYAAATGAPLWSYAINNEGPNNPVDSAP